MESENEHQETEIHDLRKFSPEEFKNTKTKFDLDLQKTNVARRIKVQASANLGVQTEIAIKEVGLQQDWWMEKSPQTQSKNVIKDLQNIKKDVVSQQTNMTKFHENHADLNNFSKGSSGTRVKSDVSLDESCSWHRTRSCYGKAKRT